MGFAAAKVRFFAELTKRFWKKLLLHLVHQFFAVGEVLNVLQGGEGNVVGGFLGEEGLVRSDYDVGHHQQQSQLVVVNHLVGTVLIEVVGFLLIDIQSGRTNLVGAQTVDEVFRLDELAAACIDNHHAKLHLGNAFVVDEELGVIGQWAMQGDDVRLFVEFIKCDQLHAVLLGESLVGIEVVGQDVHAEAMQRYQI